MSDEKASPGPWYWTSDLQELRATNPDKGKGYPPETDFPVLNTTDEGWIPSKADATLIADAPAMLELLRALESVVPSTSQSADQCLCCRLKELLDKHGRKP